MRYILFLIFSFNALLLSAQDTLTLRQAVELALQNNYEIRIARNDASIAANNVTPGMAGMLPDVGGVINQTNGVRNTHQEFITGQTVDRSGAKNSALTAAVELNWTVFDGFRMFIAYDRLQTLAALGELQARLTVESTVAEVARTYYDIVQAAANLEVLREAAALSADRLYIAQERFNAGKVSKLEVLRAEVDYRADQSALVQQERTVATLKTDLNALLVRDVAMPFNVADTIQLEESVSLENLQATLPERAPQLLAARAQQEVAAFQTREINALRYPSIGLLGGYDFSYQKSQAGLLLSNQTNGYYYGIGAAIPIFRGFTTNTAIQNARIAEESAQLVYSQALLESQTALANAFRSYQADTAIVRIEARNVVLAAQAIELAQETYKYGSITSLELREVQQQYTTAQGRYLAALFRAKAGEIELLHLSGTVMRIVEE